MKWIVIKLPVILAVLIISVSCSGGSDGNITETGRPTWQVNIASVDGFMPERVMRIYSRSCRNCHGINGQGITGIGSDLRRIPARSVTEWEKYLRESKNIHPVSQMPPLWMTADEITEMSEYLERTGKENLGR